MKVTPKNVKKFQEGGQMETPVQQTPEQGGQDPLMMLAQGAAQALQSQDCQMAMQVCQGLLQLLQQGGAPQEEEQSEPVFKRGGKISRRISK